jgi:hypothetical protein
MTQDQMPTSIQRQLFTLLSYNPFLCLPKVLYAGERERERQREREREGQREYCSIYKLVGGNHT